MYVRDAKNREEVWLLDRLDEFGFADPAFRSRDYVVAVDEQTGEKVGFGRLRVHKNSEGAIACELTNIGVLDGWRGQGVAAHIVERLVELARDQGFDEVYSLTPTGEYLEQFGFERIPESALPEKLDARMETVRENVDIDAEPFRLDVEEFSMPPRLRRRFRTANEEGEEETESPEDFGIDPETARYKYDTGRR